LCVLWKLHRFQNKEAEICQIFLELTQWRVHGQNEILLNLIDRKKYMAPIFTTIRFHQLKMELTVASSESMQFPIFRLFSILIRQFMTVNAIFGSMKICGYISNLLTKIFLLPNYRMNSRPHLRPRICNHLSAVLVHQIPLVCMDKWLCTPRKLLEMLKTSIKDLPRNNFRGSKKNKTISRSTFINIWFKIF